jgi:hypothetical protein
MMIVPNEPEKPSKTVGVITIAIAIIVVCLVGSLIVNTMYLSLNTDCLLTHDNFVTDGVLHPWYVAPMKGCTVNLYNGSQYVVHSDWWNSCEHNPDQQHLIGIGYTNRTAYDIRVKLDEDVMTRNYTATFETIIWENASQVKGVVFEAWS